MASKLYIGGLSYSTTSDGLREFFSQSGNVLSATVITDRFSGQSRGFGFVEMAAAEEAQTAISQLNGRELDGPGPLTDGDVVQIGRASLTFRELHTSGSTQTVSRIRSGRHFGRKKASRR